MNLFRGIEIIQINIINQVLQPQKQFKNKQVCMSKIIIIQLLATMKSMLETQMNIQLNTSWQF